MRSGFTLLELVIVIVILAVITTIATREIGRVQDQQRFETTQRTLSSVQEAIAGTTPYKAYDEDSLKNCFVADMGRMPKAILSDNGTELGLSELWVKTHDLAPYDVRQAIETNGVALADADPDIWIGSGWRGPYIRLPLGAKKLRDSWGRLIANQLPSGFSVLFNKSGLPVATNEEIFAIVNLGANGALGTNGADYDHDMMLAFGTVHVPTGFDGEINSQPTDAGLAGIVEVYVNGTNVVIKPPDKLVIKAFGPDPENSGKIKVCTHKITDVGASVHWNIPVTEGMTIGPRVIRAYYTDGTSGFEYVSAIKRLTLRSGINHVDLTVDRRKNE